MRGDGDVVRPAPLRVRETRARDRVPRSRDAPEPSRRQVPREATRRPRRRRRGEPRGSRLGNHPTPSPERVGGVEETPSRVFHLRERTQGCERAGDGDGADAPRVEQRARPSTRPSSRRGERLFAKSRRRLGFDAPRAEGLATVPAHREPRVHRLGARVHRTPLALLLDRLAPPPKRSTRPFSTPPVEHPSRVDAQGLSNDLRVRRDGSIGRVLPRQPPPPEEGLATVPVANAGVAQGADVPRARLRVAPFPRRRRRASVPIAKHPREEHRPRGAVTNGDADGDARHLSPPSLARQGAGFGLEVPGAELGATGAEAGVEAVRVRRNLRTTDPSHAIPLVGSFAVPVAPRADAFALDPLGAVTHHRGHRLVDEFGRGSSGRYE
mmetsp:Transcript_220/g.835  ORF Transcript_220/g.835 Transcript_220/m.835 type:complete len:382 (+) Transcript_220:258-1403(+)